MKENNGCVWKKILGVVLVLAAIAGIAYAIYRYLNPKYEDEFLDDFDDDDDAFETIWRISRMMRRTLWRMSRMWPRISRMRLQTRCLRMRSPAKKRKHHDHREFP